jgi:hypothetical protein
VAYLKELEDKYPGLEHLVIGFPMGESVAQFKAQLTVFAREVMPAFKAHKVTVS